MSTFAIENRQIAWYNYIKNQKVKIMLRILFVCHGNICRSPMAEFVFKRLVEESGEGENFEIASRATSAEELGNPVYPPAKRELMRHGIDSAGKFSIQLARSDYDRYDMLIGMDRANIRNMHRLFGGDPKGKISMLMDYTDRGGEVDDPWYSGNFEATYRDVFAGCSALFEKLKKEI